MTSLFQICNLADTVDVVLAPLAKSDHALDNCQWYEEKTVRSRLSSVVLDGVIVDGPPASSPSLSLSRYPAMPVVQECLGETFFIYLDDIDRPGETQVFGRWETMLGINGTKEIVAGQYGMLRKGVRFATKIVNLD